MENKFKVKILSFICDMLYIFLCIQFFLGYAYWSSCTIFCARRIFKASKLIRYWKNEKSNQRKFQCELINKKLQK